MNKFNQNFHRAVSASSVLVGTMLLFWGLGYIISKKMDNEIWLLILLILGVVISLYQTYKLINR